jgi:hypothetical protein
MHGLCSFRACRASVRVPVEQGRTAVPNVDLLRRTVAHIKAHPGQFNPRHWARRTASGTAYGFAATAIVLAVPDAVFEFDPADSYDLDEYRYDDVVVEAETASIVRRGDGRRARIPDAACALLGLDPACADVGRLFHPDNTPADLERTVDELCADEASPA